MFALWNLFYRVKKRFCFFGQIEFFRFRLFFDTIFDRRTEERIEIQFSFEHLGDEKTWRFFTKKNQKIFLVSFFSTFNRCFIELFQIIFNSIFNVKTNKFFVFLSSIKDFIFQDKTIKSIRTNFDHFQMTKEIFYVGTGVNSIFSCSLSSNGELELVRETKTGKGTTWLLKKDQFLYSVNEHDDQIELFSIVDRQNGQIELKGRFSALGNTPCSMDIDPSGKWLAVAKLVKENTSGIFSWRFSLSFSYGHEGTSNVAIFPLDSTKSTDGSGGQTTSIEGNGPHASRQDHSHCHQVLFDQQFLYVVDLGTDTLSVYRFDPENGQLTLHGQRIRTEPGAGPRHFVFHPDLPLMFLANELNSTMNVYRVDRSQGQLDFLQTISTRREQDLLGEYFRSFVFLSKNFIIEFRCWIQNYFPSNRSRKTGSVEERNFEYIFICVH